MPMNIDDPTIEDKMNHDYQSVESYRFVNNFHDIAANTVMGTYAHTAMTYNLYDKSYTPSTYVFRYDHEYGRYKTYRSNGRVGLAKRNTL